EHPLAAAVVEGAKARGLSPESLGEPEAFAAIPGKGVRARVGGRTVLVGTKRLLQEEGVDVSPLEADLEALERQGKTAVAAAVDGRDRKSTRLNSSHVKISYAVFCLKKKI